MPRPYPIRRRRLGGTQAASLAFLVVFAIGVILLSIWYLIPALQAYQYAEQTGNREGRQAISATAALLLSVILLILFAGLMLTLRLGRFFFPRKSPPRARTDYPDAWAESARRMPTPPPDNEFDSKDSQ